MILPLSLDGDLHVRAPWHADLVVRARGADVDLRLPRRRDLWHVQRHTRPNASPSGNWLPRADPGAPWPSAGRVLAMTDLFALRVVVSVRGHRIAERDATTGAPGARWRLHWNGILRALLAGRSATSDAAG